MLKKRIDSELKKQEALVMNSEQLRKFQMDILKVLKEFDRICVKHDIKYSICSGTLLGALRYGTFIPWDDDGDVVMLREDYEKFCKICEKELNTDEFFWQTQDTDENYNWVYGKLRLKNTVCIRRGQEGFKFMNGIFLDVFPVDNFKGGSLKRKIFQWICNVCRRILWINSGEHDTTKVRKILYKQVNKIPKSAVMKVFDSVAKRYKDEKMENLMSYNFNHKNVWGYGLKRSWFNNTFKMRLEDGEFEVLEGYKELLEGTYGSDYMTPPPEEERVGNTDPSYVKLSTGEEIFL